MDDELDERAVGTGTPVIAMVHMPASPGDPGLITARCCEIIEIKKSLNTNLPIFADVYEPHAVPLGAKPIEYAAWETVHEALTDGLFLSGKTAKESIAMIERARTKVSDSTIFFLGGNRRECTGVIEILRWDLCC